MSDITILYQSCVTESVPDNLKSVCLDDLSRFDEIVQALPKDMYERYIFHVSIEMRKKLYDRCIYPFILDDEFQFNYDFLMSFFPEQIINKDAQFKTFAQVIHQINNGGLRFPFFIRPVSGNKTFSGQVIKDKIDLNTLKDIERVEPLEMCVISSVKEFQQETRTFVYMDGVSPRFIGITPYWHEGEAEHKGIDENLLKPFLKVFDNNPMMPDIFVADFAISDGKVGLVELNSVSTSGCYNAHDIDEKIAAIISEYQTA